MAKPKDMAARAMVETAIWMVEPALLPSAPVGVGEAEAEAEEEPVGLGEAAERVGRLPSGL